MPGVASLDQQRYYGHPRNAFWDILGELVGAHRELPYAERLQILQHHRIALWDVIGKCRRKGSLDSAIQDVEANDIAGLLRRHASLRTIFLNGGRAATEFRRHVERPHAELLRDRSVVKLPSTSPAYAALDLAGKLAAWRVLERALEPGDGS